MKIKRILPIALGLAMIAVASVQGYAFMVASTTVTAPEGQLDVIQLVEDLRVEVADEELACEAKLAKLDQALEDIDAILDGGVEDERGLLVAREAIAEMRLAVPCATGNQLTGTSAGAIGDNVISDTVVGERLVDLGPIAQVGHTSGGGGGGPLKGVAKATHGGSKLGKAALIGGIITAITVPIVTAGDDDAPGPPATP